jgi:hypothetical protein
LESFRRHRLHADCRRDSTLCRRVTDLLDLRHLDTVQFVRHSPLEAIEETVTTSLRAGLRGDLPGLLWATTTDPRAPVQELGRRLAGDLMSCACDLIREVIDFTDPRAIEES